MKILTKKKYDNGKREIYFLNRKIFSEIENKYIRASENISGISGGTTWRNGLLP